LVASVGGVEGNKGVVREALDALGGLTVKIRKKLIHGHSSASIDICDCIPEDVVVDALMDMPYCDVLAADSVTLAPVDRMLPENDTVGAARFISFHWNGALRLLL
jgi:hypothetical protein